MLIVGFWLLLLVAVAVPRYAQNVHAARVGTVCLADPTSPPLSNPCAASPGPTFNGPVTGPNTQITIGVFINGSDPLNGFDIQVKTNASFLRAGGVGLSGSVVIAPLILFGQCLDGVGFRCGATDGLGIVHLAIASQSYTTAPTTGLLFTVVYNITGITPTGGIPIGFQTGCGSGTSQPPLCVTILQTPLTNAEAVRTGTFDNHATTTNLPFVTMKVTPNTIGPVLPSSRTFTATVTTSSNWPGFSANSVTFSFLANSGFQGTFSPTGCTGLGASASCSVNLTTSSTPPLLEGNYSITVLAHYVSNDLGTPNLQSNTLAATYTVQFIVFGYRLSLNPSPLLPIQAAPGSTVSLIATITSITGFSGSGTLSVLVFPAGLSVTVTPGSTFALAAGGTVTETLSIHQTAAIPTAQGFRMQVRAVIGNQTRSTPTFMVNFNGFGLTPAFSSISLNSGSSLNDTILVRSLPAGNSVLGYSGTVTLTNSTYPSSGLTVNCNASPNPVFLNAGGSTSINCKFSSSMANFYNVTLTATGGNPVGSISNTTSIVVIVAAPTITNGGGSVAHGTLITMANGSNVPVQNLRVGDQMLGYDTSSGQFTVSTVLSLKVVDTTNMLVINTEAGTPFRVDANPAQTLWTMRSDGSILWLPVTEIKVGDSLFTATGWVRVTSIEFAPAGQHIMFDIIATAPYFASGYLDPLSKL